MEKPTDIVTALVNVDTAERDGINDVKEALYTLQSFQQLEKYVKEGREKIYKLLEAKGIGSTEVEGFKIEKSKPTIAYSIPSDKLLSIKNSNPDLFSAITKPGILLSDDEKEALEAEQATLMVKEAEISDRLNSDELARTPQIIDNTDVVEALIKPLGIEMDEKVTRKGCYKVVKAKAKADK